MNRKEDIIGTDFQGWPVYKMNYREIIESIGFEKIDGKYQISENAGILDKYPVCLEDDGMGYGVNGKYVTEADNNGIIFIEGMTDIKDEETSDWIKYLDSLEDDGFAMEIKANIILLLHNDLSITELKAKVKSYMTYGPLLQKYGFTDINEVNWGFYKL